MISLSFSEKEIRFIFDVLSTQNLPWVQTHPIIQSINTQLAQVVAPVAKADTKVEVTKEKSK